MSKNISLFYLDILNVLIKIACQSLQSCPTLCDAMDCCWPGSSVHGIFPSKNTGVGCHSLLQGIFLTQGSNLYLLCLLHWWWILYHWATREALIKINYNSYHNFKTYYTKIKISIKFPPVYIITFFLFSLFLSLFLFFITFLCCNETI